MNIPSTLLIIPPNDPEAVLISKIAQAMKIPMILSGQTHGASLDKGKDFLSIIKEGKYQTVIIVEMPGIKTEKKLHDLGFELILIDHHHYTGLDRAHDKKSHKLLKSSLEQFLKLFRLSNSRLKKLGFDPRLVRGIGIYDRGFVWQLQKEGYSKKEISAVMSYADQLMEKYLNPKTEALKKKQTKQIWDKRKKWHEYFIVESRADIQLRPRLSRIIAEEIGKPTSIIIIEHKRKLIYVQESPKAMKLFEKFGGFTFGQDLNWGYRNEKGNKQIKLKDIQEIL